MLNLISKIYLYSRYQEKIQSLEAEYRSSITRFIGSYLFTASSVALRFLGNSLIYMRQFIARIWPLSDSAKAEHDAALTIFAEESFLQKGINKSLKEVDEKAEQEEDEQAAVANPEEEAQVINPEEERARAQKAEIEAYIAKLEKKISALRESYVSVSRLYGSAPLTVIAALGSELELLYDYYLSTSTASWENFSKIVEDKSRWEFLMQTFGLISEKHARNEITKEQKIAYTSDIIAALTQDTVIIDTYCAALNAMGESADLDLSKLSKSDRAIYDLYASISNKAEQQPQNNNQKAAPEVLALKKSYQTYANSRDSIGIATDLLNNATIKDLLSGSQKLTEQEVRNTINQIIFADKLKNNQLDSMLAVFESDNTSSDAVALKSDLDLIVSMIFSSAKTITEPVASPVLKPSATVVPSQAAANINEQLQLFFKQVNDAVLDEVVRLKLFKRSHRTYLPLRQHFKENNATNQTMKEYLLKDFKILDYIDLKDITEKVQQRLQHGDERTYLIWSLKSLTTNKDSFYKCEGLFYEQLLDRLSQHVLAECPALARPIFSPTK